MVDRDVQIVDRYRKVHLPGHADHEPWRLSQHLEKGCDLIGGSATVAATGEIVAKARTLGDEIIVADCDLDRCAEISADIFDFAKHHRS